MEIKMEHNRRLLGCQRKIRSFRANFEKFLAIVQFNKVQIMTASNFGIIDVSNSVSSWINGNRFEQVLEGHTMEIMCMDVSQITKAVVSYSQNLLLVHVPIKSEGAFMSDHVISLGSLK